jgi:hypothetical protein
MAVIFGLDYFWIGNFANHIWKRTMKAPKWKQTVNVTAIYVMTVLNIFVLVMDVKSYLKKRLSFFLGAICLRGILLPVLALFHPIVGFLFHTADSVLQWVFRGAAILSVLMTIAALIGEAVVSRALSTFRFDVLPSLPLNWSNVPSDRVGLPICVNRYEGLSVIELVGLALGGYDVNRSESVFNRQLDFFFGPNSTFWIDYEVVELGPGIPVLIYNISGTMVFAFRGFASSSELAVQVERLASLWVVPFILDELPLYEKITQRYMSSSTALAHLFGWHWFSPRSASDDLLQKAVEVYDDFDLAVDAPVLFVGVNSGGTIAKSLTLLKGRLGISFISLPLSIDEFDDRHDLESNATQWVSVVVNKDGLFSGEDTGFGENVALIGDPDIVGYDGVYASFCNLAEICGHHSQFVEYCKAAIGSEQLAKIRAYLGRSGGDATD